MSSCSCSGNQLTNWRAKDRIFQDIDFSLLLHLGPWCVRIMAVRKIFFQFIWSQTTWPFYFSNFDFFVNVWWYVNAHVFILEKWKKSSFPPPPIIDGLKKERKLLLLLLCVCVCLRLLLNLDQSVPNCEQLSSSSPCLATKRKATFWALVSEIKLWIQFSIDISPLPLCLSISIFLYFHLSSSSQCFTEHVELEGSFCCCCVCMCVGCVFSIFPFWAFFSKIKRCGVWCGSRQRRRKTAKFLNWKLEKKTRRRREEEGKILMAHLKQESG